MATKYWRPVQIISIVSKLFDAFQCLKMPTTILKKQKQKFQFVLYEIHASLKVEVSLKSGWVHSRSKVLVQSFHAELMIVLSSSLYLEEIVYDLVQFLVSGVCAKRYIIMGSLVVGEKAATNQRFNQVLLSIVYRINVLVANASCYWDKVAMLSTVSWKKINCRLNFCAIFLKSFTKTEATWAYCGSILLFASFVLLFAVHDCFWFDLRVRWTVSSRQTALQWCLSNMRFLQTCYVSIFWTHVIRHLMLEEHEVLPIYVAFKIRKQQTPVSPDQRKNCHSTVGLGEQYFEGHLFVYRESFWNIDSEFFLMQLSTSWFWHFFFLLHSMFHTGIRGCASQQLLENVMFFTIFKSVVDVSKKRFKFQWQGAQQPTTYSFFSAN